MAQSHAEKRIAVLGLGNMGHTLAEALLAHGHKVTAWNRTAAKGEALAKSGATVAATVVEAAQAGEILLLCVRDYDASMSILATDGMAAALKEKSIIQLSTMSASESVALDTWARRHGANYLDGAILGYPPDVRDGTARILFSGSKDVFENSRDVLDALSSQAIFVGEKPGTAQIADKLVYAQFYGITFAYLHTAAMSAAAGISIQDFRELTSGEERWLWKGKTMDRFLDMIENRDYSDEGATLEAHAAAYGHIVRISRELDIEPDFPALISNTIAQGLERGHGKQELAAIFDVFSRDREGEKGRPGRRASGL